MPSQLDALTRINIEDMLESLGWQGMRRGRGVLEALFHLPARRFAEQVATYDRLVGERGLPYGAEWILKRYLRELRVSGQERIPAHGPLLVLSNHPGMADTVALFVGLGRPDLRIVALERPFLQALPNTSRQLIYVPNDEGERMPVVRAVIAQLRAGQPVLTFPSGEIEPDPIAHGAGRAAQALESWSESFGLFVRRVPEALVMVAIVSGVLSVGAQRHPLARLRRTSKDRERMAATLQILIPAYQGVTVRVAFGEPCSAAGLTARFPDSAGLKQALIAQARRLIEHPPAEWRTVLRGLR
jgi:1-acyl-sn-glycerol-3-phosphate acyltransferase